MRSRLKRGLSFVRALWRASLVVIVTPGLMGGCALGPNYKRPAVETPGAYRFATGAGSSSLADLPWWQVFKDPILKDLIGTVKVMLDNYRDAKLDRLLLVHNIFVNTMTQKGVVSQLLPIQTIDKVELQERWDYIYEPEALGVVDSLMVRYIEALIYQAVAENLACEQSARMVAMKSASDNAKTVVDELKLVYNKTRQAAITQEISEIVAGASAV